MRLLILTQKIDQSDDILGFFHGWVKELSQAYEKITVVCLQKGSVSLPSNVEVFSLGKEERQSSFFYVVNFYRLIWRERKNYDAVFVHMNQEYVLLGGLFWKLLGKKVFLWRNHPHGSFITRLAVLLADKCFCTSTYSYTARFKKTVIMPVGIDTDFFVPTGIQREPGSLLMLGRLSPIKGQDFFIKALAVLSEKRVNFSAYIVGSALPQHANFEIAIKESAHLIDPQEKNIHFQTSVPNTATPLLYNQNEIFINVTPSGSYDKTIFEAMACESLVLVSNKNLRGHIDDIFVFEEGNEEDFEKKLVNLIRLSYDEKQSLGKMLRSYVIENHSLKKLCVNLRKEIG